MPVIRQYGRRVSNQSSSIRREQGADAFGAAEGRGLQQLGQGVQQAGNAIQKRQEQKELSDLNLRLSKAQADNAIAYQDFLRDVEPGDDKAFEDFEKKSQERLDEVGTDLSTSKGKDYFKTSSAKMSANTSVSLANSKAQLEGEKAVMDYESSLNNYSAALVSDPSSLELTKENFNKMNENLLVQGLVSKTDAAKLKVAGEKTLAKSHIRGWTKLNPAHAKQRLASGDFDRVLGGETKLQLMGEIAQAERAGELELKRQEIKTKEMRALDIKETQNDFIGKMIDNNLSAKDVRDSNLDPVGSGSKAQFLRMIEASNNKGGKLKTNPGVFTNLFKRIHLDDGDPNKIVSEDDLNEELIKGNLDHGDLAKLRNEIEGNNTEEGRILGANKKQLFKIAAGKLTRSNPLTGVTDPLGDTNMLLYQQFVYQEIEDQKKAKKPLKDLFNPNHKDYVGNHIGTYQRSSQEIMQEQMNSLVGSRKDGLAKTNKEEAPDTPPEETKPTIRKTGESISAYLERKKKAGK